MAVLFNNRYYKILGCEQDADNATSKIKVDIYATTETREKEKRIFEAVNQVKVKISEYIINEFNKIRNEIANVVPNESIADMEKFKIEYPLLYEDIKAYESMRDESFTLRQDLMENNIEFSSLIFKDIWVELGLSEEMCKRIEKVGQGEYKMPRKEFNNLSDMYAFLKSKLIGQVIDC
ncbi:MAG: hypothetical protein IJZ29_02740 [Clostridia bacterium]|nr:hypothetical protein [Clostridia bacterium]